MKEKIKQILKKALPWTPQAGALLIGIGPVVGYLIGNPPLNLFFDAGGPCAGFYLLTWWFYGGPEEYPSAFQKFSPRRLTLFRGAFLGLSIVASGLLLTIIVLTCLNFL